MLTTLPEKAAKLIVTSPPYNMAREYERGQKLTLDEWLEWQTTVVKQCLRALHPQGSICWQVGNYVDKGEIIPLDCLLFPTFRKYGLVMRNRIVWTFEHGLHCKNRFSGRHETIMWWTWPAQNYTFNLDPVRVPQKYPGKKHFKGPKKGELSGNPLGKSPGDVWNVPSVKANHVEKTEHPCQFPVELIERLVLSMTEEGDLVVDPFVGSGSSAIAALMHGRRFAGSDKEPSYMKIMQDRIAAAERGELRIRPRERTVHVPGTKAGEPLTVRLP